MKSCNSAAVYVPCGWYCLHGKSPAGWHLDHFQRTGCSIHQELPFPLLPMTSREMAYSVALCLPALSVGRRLAKSTQSKIHSVLTRWKIHTVNCMQKFKVKLNTVVSEAERRIPVCFPLELDSDETFKIVLWFAHVALSPFCLL